jgi:hypothetical protein
MNTVKVRRAMVGTPVRTPTGWEIPSMVTGEIYTIEQDFWGRWSCTCANYGFRGCGHQCKHIRKVIATLEAEEEVLMGS